MAEPSPKQLALEPIEDLPADATIEDAMERLYFLARVHRGLAEAEAGNRCQSSDGAGAEKRSDSKGFVTADAARVLEETTRFGLRRPHVVVLLVHQPDPAGARWHRGLGRPPVDRVMVRGRGDTLARSEAGPPNREGGTARPATRVVRRCSRRWQRSAAAGRQRPRSRRGRVFLAPPRIVGMWETGWIDDPPAP